MSAEKLHFLFSEPLSSEKASGSDKDWINLLNIQHEQNVILYSAYTAEAPVKMKIAPGTATEIRDAIKAQSVLLHLSCHISAGPPRPELYLESKLKQNSYTQQQIDDLLDTSLGLPPSRIDNPQPNFAYNNRSTRSCIGPHVCRNRGNDEYPPTEDAPMFHPSPIDSYMSQSTEIDEIAIPLTVSPEPPSSQQPQLPFKIVVLNGCYSQLFAPCFLRRGVEHVICYPLDKKLSDDVAVKFSSVFYEHLLRGESVYDAFQYAQCEDRKSVV